MGRSFTRGSFTAQALGGAAVIFAAGCAMGPDSSWGPLRSPGQLASMTATLVPDGELRIDLPRFEVRQEVLPSGLRLGVESSETR